MKLKPNRSPNRALTSRNLIIIFVGVVSFVSLVFLTNGSVSEAWAEPAPASMTIRAAVDRALSSNPDVLKAREAIHQSDAEFSGAISKMLPTLSLDALANYQKDAADLNFVNFGGESYNQYQVGLNLVQPLFDGGAMFAGLRYGKKDRKIHEYGVQIAERDISQSVIEAFYTILLNQRQLQILQDSLAVDQAALKVAERYFRSGRIQKVDLLQLKTQTALLKPRISQTENQLQTSAAQLAILLRNVDSQTVRVKGKLASPDLDWVKSMASQKKSELPEILQSRMQVDQFEDARTVQMAQYWPKLNLVGQLGRTAFAKTDLLDGNATNWSIGLQLSIPIFSGLSSVHQRDSLVSQEKQMEFDETKTADTVSVNQIQTEKDLSLASTQLTAAKEAAEFGREAMHEAQTDFKFSTINYLQFQTAQQTFLDSETNYFLAKYNYIVAVAKYFNATGIPLSTLVDQLEKESL